ncbi:MAG: RDD family protein [Candidatus Hodarchaeota archaeon]
MKAHIDLMNYFLAETSLRVKAIIIDIIILTIISGIIYLLSIFLEQEELSMSIRVLSLLISAVYFIGLTYYTDGQTIGKMAMNIRVMALDENNAVVSVKGNWAAIVLRYLFYSIDFICCGIVAWIVIERSDYQQRVGDIAARTVVVRIPPK